MRKITTILSASLLSVATLMSCSSPKDATVYESWAGFSTGGVKSSVCYRAESEDVSLSDAKNEAGDQGGFNLTEFNTDGKITNYFGVEFEYNQDGGLTGAQKDGTQVNVLKSSKGQVLKLELDSEDTDGFILSFNYDEKGNLVWEEGQYWEFAITSEYSYNDKNELVAGKDHYFSDYETEVNEDIKYETLEVDSRGNWTKRLVSSQIDSYTVMLGEEDSGTHTITNDKFVILREIEYY